MNNFHPLVSIVIPVYNGSNYMQCAIDSALGQDYDNIEVIVVNDGSQDNTNEIAKSYGDKIRYFTKENGGVSTALNLTIQNAKGEYISWLSHDDYYLSNKISRQIEELERIADREKLIPCCSEKIVDVVSHSERINIISDYTTAIMTRLGSIKLLYASYIGGCSFLIPLKAFKEVGFFNPELRTTQDNDLWFRFIDAGYLFYYISDVLVISRRHGEQVSLVQVNLCHYERLKLWDFANKLFYNDIKNSSKDDKKIFKKRNKNNEFLSYIKQIMYIHSPIFLKRIVIRKIWEKVR